MKEFRAQNGGRYTYADDLENLQELALAFSQIFDDCDNFIVSGCEVDGNSVSAGYVYLNGKLRRFSGASDLSAWPQYLIESNYTESVPYESGQSKVGRNVYDVIIGGNIPSSLDPLTNQTPAVIEIGESGAPRLKDAFIGKYALLLDPGTGAQRVNSPVNFGQTVYVDGNVSTNGNVVVKSGALSTTAKYQGSDFVLQVAGGDFTYKIIIEDGDGFKFYVDEDLVATISDTLVTFHKPLSAPHGTFNGLVISGSNLYQGTANTVANVDINMVSYAGGITQYRNTRIGNGKNKAIVSVTGSNGAIDIAGSVTISQGSVEGLVLKGNVAHTNASLVNAIVWKDSSNTVMANVGFISTADQTFSITSPLYGMSISASGFVNIAPAIKENGVLLSDKYASKSATTAALETKANLSDVYSKTDADERYGRSGRGLAQFVSQSSSAAKCRADIGALGVNELGAYAKLDRFLADMAVNDAAKRLIRSNIGAVGYEEIPTATATNNSGWIAIPSTNLKVRQIGNVVCIQGSVVTKHTNKTVFTLPNNIAPPTYAVEKTICFSNSKAWSCAIAANSRACVTTYCNGSCGLTTNFSLTYMV